MPAVQLNIEQQGKICMLRPENESMTEPQPHAESSFNFISWFQPVIIKYPNKIYIKFLIQRLM
jgi:hypothetical protein